jgi:hypothetical protein
VVADGLRNGVASLLVMAFVVLAALTPRLLAQLGPRPSPEQCSSLVSRFVAHESRARNHRLREDVVQEQLGSLEARPILERQLASCEKALVPAQVECALGAPNVDELERCLQ